VRPVPSMSFQNPKALKYRLRGLVWVEGGRDVPFRKRGRPVIKFERNQLILVQKSRSRREGGGKGKDAIGRGGLIVLNKSVVDSKANHKGEKFQPKRKRNEGLLRSGK